MSITEAIDYLRPIQESATVGRYGEALAAVMWAAEQYIEGGTE